MNLVTLCWLITSYSSCWDKSGLPVLVTVISVQVKSKYVGNVYRMVNLFLLQFLQLQGQVPATSLGIQESTG